MSRARDRLRRWVHGLRLTPLHPQFLAYRHERLRYQVAGKLCSGWVLDIGCGRQPLRKYLPGECDYVALDHPTTGAWYDAKPNVQADASRLPFADKIFDTIVCLEVLEHLPPPQAALREARRLLKPEGRLIISTPFLYPIHDAPNDYQRWTRHGLELLARSSGFRVESLRGQGSPLECGALLFNLGLTWQAMNASALGRILLLVLVLLITPLSNVLGLIHSRLAKTEGNSPFATGYMAVLRY